MEKVWLSFAPIVVVQLQKVLIVDYPDAITRDIKHIR